ncbi:hypothetical protein ACQ4PT_046125 [Festuca glaucescens]
MAAVAESSGMARIKWIQLLRPSGVFDAGAELWSLLSPRSESLGLGKVFPGVVGVVASATSSWNFVPLASSPLQWCLPQCCCSAYEDKFFENRTSDVGKLELLQDLRSFMVKKENIGFEMRQISRLAEFGVSLRIHSIENAEQQEEVNEAKLIHKTHIQKLMLEWGIDRPNKDPAKEDHALESLQPHCNLLELHIGGHGGATCPSWLGSNLSVKALESLCLVDVAWNNFPPLGELLFVSELGEEHPSGIPSQSFQNLKELKLVKVSRLKKWVGISTCRLVSLLEVLIIKDCFELVELPFSGCESVQEAYVTWFPRLQKLEIMDCPKLLALPPVPWTSAPCSVKIARVGSGFEQLIYSKNCRSESSLEVTGKEGGHDSTFWNIFEPQISPRSCKIEEITTDDHTGFLAAPICSLLSSSLTKLYLKAGANDEVERFSTEQEDALQLLSSLQELEFYSFRKLQCLPAGLRRISSLKTLRIENCQAFRSLPKDGLPYSLQYLGITCPALKSLPKEGLPSSLQDLVIRECPALKSLPEDGLPSSLRKLDIRYGNSKELMWQCHKLKGTIPIIQF